LNPDIADVVWKQIKKNASLEEDNYGLTSDMCVFCVLHEDDNHNHDCDICAYGKNHGMCNQDTSNTFELIFDTICEELDAILIPKWYIKTNKSIDKM